MANYKVKTKDNSNPKGKPRVYFTCHSDDFEGSFESVCRDIFETHDCAIYYLENITDQIDSQSIDSELGEMNLFVVPITFKLLREENRAMRLDISYAKEKNIPILPLMMEQGIDTLYSLDENFGNRQYLTPLSVDSTLNDYKNKLKKYLDTILVSKEMADRIRSAFDAYIFLSYRKKDRSYATQLMKIIHDIPKCRDIAIWYDEFLTPGESFVENIESAMKQSKLFALIVTPNILEEDNYVMREEYPAAKRLGMDILPTEMEKTDRERLSCLFDGIPSPVHTDDQEFSLSLIRMLEKIAKSENDGDNEHNFLIGLAYLDGIDVEIDRDRALKLIGDSAEAGLTEAMEKMYHIYHDGIRSLPNHKLAAYWAEKLLNYSRAKNEERHEDMLVWSYRLASSLGKAWERSALKAAKDSYDLHRRAYGKTDERSLLALSEIGVAYTVNKEFKKARKIGLKVCRLTRKLYGKNHEITLRAYSDLSLCCHKAFKFKEALKYEAIAYEGFCKIFGEEHPETLTLLSNTAFTCHQMGQLNYELQILDKVLEGRMKALGADHPDTVETVSSIGVCYMLLNNNEEAIRCYRFVIKKQNAIFGKKNNKTLLTARRLIDTLKRTGKEAEAKEIAVKYLKED